jgi:cellulose synthase (UDP-forming)
LAYIATRQWFDVPDKDFNHDYLFYEYMQPGKGTSNAAISCGSGVIYRRSALLAVGGFSEWNVVEDLHTSYVLNAHGYKGIYTNQSYTNGVAPTDLPTIYKQRGTWALDSLRLMLWQVPRPQPLLSLTQKLHYFEMGYIYLVSAVMLPAIFFLNYYSLFFNVTFIAAGWWYLVFKLPAFFFTLKLYNDLGRGQSASRMWAALFPVYFRSLWLAMLYKKPVYQVTEKRRAPVPDQSLRLIWPQAMTVGLGIVAIVYHLAHFHFTSLLAVNFFWMGVILYWLWPIFPKAWASRGAV